MPWGAGEGGEGGEGGGQKGAGRMHSPALRMRCLLVAQVCVSVGVFKRLIGR